MCSDADAPLCMEVSHPKARKPHKCFECGQIIGIGQKYEYTKGVWPDGPSQFKVCLVCVEIRGMLGCTSVAFGEVMEQATEEEFDFWGHHKSKAEGKGDGHGN